MTRRQLDARPKMRTVSFRTTGSQVMSSSRNVADQLRAIHVYVTRLQSAGIDLNKKLQQFFGTIIDSNKLVCYADDFRTIRSLAYAIHKRMQKGSSREEIVAEIIPSFKEPPKVAGKPIDVEKAVGSLVDKLISIYESAGKSGLLLVDAEDIEKQFPSAKSVRLALLPKGKAITFDMAELLSSLKIPSRLRITVSDPNSSESGPTQKKFMITLIAEKDVNSTQQPVTKDGVEYVRDSTIERSHVALVLNEDEGIILGRASEATVDLQILFNVESHWRVSRAHILLIPKGNCVILITKTIEIKNHLKRRRDH